MSTIEFIKLMATMFFGGLAGAIINEFFKRKTASREQKRLLIRATKVEYKLTDMHTQGQPLWQDLQVTFNKTSYPDLFRYSILVKNIGGRRIDGVKMYLLCATDLQVVSVISRRPREGYKEQNTSKDYDTKMSDKNIVIDLPLPLLETDEEYDIHIMANAKDQSVQWGPKNFDDVTIAESNDDFKEDRYKEVNILLSLLALFVFFNSIQLHQIETSVALGLAKAILPIVAIVPVKKLVEKTTSQKNDG